MSVAKQWFHLLLKMLHKFYINPLRPNSTKWSKTLKQFVGYCELFLCVCNGKYTNLLACKKHFKILPHKVYITLIVFYIFFLHLIVNYQMFKYHHQIVLDSPYPEFVLMPSLQPFVLVRII